MYISTDYDLHSGLVGLNPTATILSGHVLNLVVPNGADNGAEVGLRISEGLRCESLVVVGNEKPVDGALVGDPIIVGRLAGLEWVGVVETRGEEAAAVGPEEGRDRTWQHPGQASVQQA